MPSIRSLIHSAYQHWSGRDLVHIQERRERRMLVLGSMAMVGMGLFWGVFFAYLGNWPLVVLDAVLVSGGVGVAALTWFKQERMAAVTFFATLLLVICVIAWVFDAASPAAPRTTHLYLLPLSVAALMAFRTASAWLRHGVFVTCLLALAFLGMTYGSPLPQYALPEDVRAVGGWIQSGVALALFYVMLQLLRNDAAVRSRLENDLRQAIVHKQFQLYFQPQLDLQGRVIGAEALIRWLHPQRGLVLPAVFIEVAEQTGLILPMGQWVMEAACRQLQNWAGEPALRHIRLAVNVSPLQFRQADFVAQVTSLLDRFQVDAGRLEIELTESMLAQDLPDIIQKMSALRARGIGLSLDDFGTGYSSLNYLKRLPLNQLKIDQSFVRDVLTDANDASIARTIITLGHNLALTVIAEGVQTQAQCQFLADCGCEFFQGYLFSAALAIDDFNAYALAHGR